MSGRLPGEENPTKTLKANECQGNIRTGARRLTQRHPASGHPSSSQVKRPSKLQTGEPRTPHVDRDDTSNSSLHSSLGAVTSSIRARVQSQDDHRSTQDHSSTDWLNRFYEPHVSLGSALRRGAPREITLVRHGRTASKEKWQNRVRKRRKTMPWISFSIYSRVLGPRSDVVETRKRTEQRSMIDAPLEAQSTRTLNILQNKAKHPPTQNSLREESNRRSHTVLGTQTKVPSQTGVFC